MQLEKGRIALSRLRSRAEVYELIQVTDGSPMSGKQSAPRIASVIV